MLKEDGLASLLRALVRSGNALSYINALSAVGGDEDVLLMAHELGIIMPYRPDARCLEWDNCPLGPGSILRLNPAVEAVLRALAEGRGILEGLIDLFRGLGLSDPEARALAHVALDLARRRVVSGSDVASSCRSRGLKGFESTAVAILKAAGVMSPILSSSWPAGDVRYRTCRFLALLAEDEGFIRMIKGHNPGHE